MKNTLKHKKSNVKSYKKITHKLQNGGHNPQTQFKRKIHKLTKIVRGIRNLPKFLEDQR